ncbi:MAG: helix-turn-helix domain-containing protein [Patescibacteria group bacterium]|nr:helix-turn-helix domain-containing protein [Patescibacteria group bacterium]
MTPKFIKTSVRKSENLGEKLEKKRASLGYEIKDVERSIRIRAKHIEYIEAGEWEKLPPDVYVRGFLRSYATFLRLNPDKVILLYLKEKGLKSNVARATTVKETEPKKKKDKKPKVIITPKLIAIFSAILIGLSVLLYIGWQVSILAAPPKLEVATPSDNLKVTEDSVIIEGVTDSGANVYINNVPIGVSPEGGFKENVSLKEGVNLIKISAKNRLDKETEVTRTIVAELAEIANNEKSTPDTLSMEIEVGPDSSALYITADGKVVSGKDSVMLPGSTQKVNATKSIIVRASSPKNVRIILNGKDLGTLGTGEKEIEKEFTQESI